MHALMCIFIPAQRIIPPQFSSVVSLATKYFQVRKWSFSSIYFVSKLPVHGLPHSTAELSTMRIPTRIESQFIPPAEFALECADDVSTQRYELDGFADILHQYVSTCLTIKRAVDGVWSSVRHLLRWRNSSVFCQDRNNAQHFSH